MVQVPSRSINAIGRGLVRSNAVVSTEPTTLQGELPPGFLIDERYRIVRKLGEGGMGTVYEVDQIALQRRVALKVLHPEFATQTKSVQRFQREARAASSIQHRNVVRVFDTGILPSGATFYAMEMLYGSDLADVLSKQGPLPWRRAGWIFLQLAQAFAAIHAVQIIHRDIKPANCFLVAPRPDDPPDFVKVLDFGIADVRAHEELGLTGTSDIIGSALYISPEQVLGKQVDPRSDIYSFGITMYELLTGQVPFNDTNPFKVMVAHVDDVPPPPRSLVPDLPPEVEAIILRCIEKDPDHRFSSMAELESELFAWVTPPEGLPFSPTPIDRRTSAQTMHASDLSLPLPTKSSPRRRWISLVALGVFAASVSAAVTLRWAMRTPEVSPEEPSVQDAPEVSPTPPVDEAKAKPLPPVPPEPAFEMNTDPFGAPASILATLADPPLADAWRGDPGVLVGQVQNARQRAIARAQVCAWVVDPRTPSELRRRPKCSHTDRRGRFDLRDLAPGLYEVHVAAEDYLPQSTRSAEDGPVIIRAAQRTSGLAFTLQPGGREIGGRVQTEFGEPIAGARVAALGQARPLAVADDSGAFTLWVPEPSEGDSPLHLVAWADGYADAVALIEDGDIRFSLRRHAMIIGRVIDQDGEGITGARVWAGPQGGGINPRVYTDETGAFRLIALPSGTYEPFARTDLAYAVVDTPLQVVDGTMQEAHLVLGQR